MMDDDEVRAGNATTAMERHIEDRAQATWPTLESEAPSARPTTPPVAVPPVTKSSVNPLAKVFDIVDTKAWECVAGTARGGDVPNECESVLQRGHEFCYVTIKGEEPEMLRVPFRDMARCAFVTCSSIFTLSRLATVSGVRAVEYKRLKQRPKEAPPIDVSPQEASQLAADAWEKAVGALPTDGTKAEREVSMKSSLKSLLQEKVYSLTLEEGDQALAFPCEFSKAQRKLVHEVAEELGLTHQSEGCEPHRRITVHLTSGGGHAEKGEAAAETNSGGSEGDAEEEEREEWWRVRCFYDKQRPDFALLRGLTFYHAGSITKTEKYAKAVAKKSNKQARPSEEAPPPEGEVDPARFASGGGAKAPVSYDKTALITLSNMGFTDAEACRQALWVSDGDVERATHRLIQQAELSSIRRDLKAPKPLQYVLPATKVHDAVGQELRDRLQEMGFRDMELNEAALGAVNGDLNEAVAWLSRRKQHSEQERARHVSKGAGVRLAPAAFSTEASSYAALAAPPPDPNSIEAIRASLGAPQGLL